MYTTYAPAHRIPQHCEGWIRNVQYYPLHICTGCAVDSYSLTPVLPNNVWLMRYTLANLQKQYHTTRNCNQTMSVEILWFSTWCGTAEKGQTTFVYQRTMDRQTDKQKTLPETHNGIYYQTTRMINTLLKGMPFCIAMRHTPEIFLQFLYLEKKCRLQK